MRGRSRDNNTLARCPIGLDALDFFRFRQLASMANNGKINRCFVAFSSVQRRPPTTTIEQIHICAYCDTQICTHRRIRYLDLFVVPLPLDSAEPIYLLYAVEHVAIHSLCDVGRMPSIFFVFSRWSMGRCVLGQYRNRNDGSGIVVCETHGKGKVDFRREWQSIVPLWPL